ncbi:hypothetical protein BATDEDRAFT_90296 [Batrachochytrium dendrobatidis JAM81]|uniref:Translation machinery-associated protein 20 n=2 Tax=Batrachochytrium dendrobatidis TaxID=109871 RepID=F4P6Q1_BATDJ|nr:translation machinery-associated protein 20 [Batrachochytrium dendrobatidis JAM81]EGF78855.1 hypothetical protein BATDEDRAFT_90296 [Batrachochytrium dendrobatidis JAM81]KAK5667451.1 translation machinery-associated protein 20 [Batrachochytrium dendrobatidis]OAJ42307.1 hypothetical protein BDEG_25774 [Batrachochytrium dendrobatidis JEL423]|eukprot:XP_006680485.1 hypothetical protein BATDEDRAFT_90296 [Batrachochytrium dendrobatidis JAM81]
MFKKFNLKEDIAGQTQVKSSVQRNFRAKIVEQFPLLAPYIDDLIPKKDPVFLVKCLDRVNIISVNNKFLFFNSFDGPFFPSLYILHKYPDILPKLQVDRGAIKFVLKAADIMCPGLTSPGGNLPSESLPAETVVAIYAQGKEHAVAVGMTKMATDDMKKINKGIGVSNAHYLNDGLWKTLH